MKSSFPAIRFIFDCERDLQNIYDACTISPKWGNDFSKSLNPQLIKIAQGKSFSECRKELEVSRKEIYDSPLIPSFLKAIEGIWHFLAKDYFTRLERVTGRTVFHHEITCYLTTVPKCPYNPREYSFMINFFDSLPGNLRTIGHEVFHLQFHEFFFEELKNKIGIEQTHILKESLTTLLNLEFKDLWLVKDRGYPEHQSLRNFIEETWSKEKKFDMLLVKCAHYIKNERGSN